MGKRQDKNPLANSRFVDDSSGWTDSPEDELSDEVMDTVWMVLDKASINARKRKIIWADGRKLTINQSVKRIHADHQRYPPELNRLTGKWIEAHQSQAEAAQKAARTRYS